MAHASKRGVRGYDRSGGMSVVESLEGRRLLSVGLAEAVPVWLSNAITPISVGPTPVPIPVSQGGVTIQEKQGVAFTAAVGSFFAIAPVNTLSATINWGDGTAASPGKIVPVPSATAIDAFRFNVVGTHTYADSGKFPIVVTVTQSYGPPGSLSPIRLVTVIRSTAVVTAASNLKLDGNIVGSYSLAPSAVSIGAVYVFNGTGAAGAMGPVQAAGKVQLPPPFAVTATGQASGTLTLTNISASPLPGGSVTLQLTGPAQSSFSPFPKTLKYVITGGTGAFADALGSGTIDVLLDPIGMHFTFVIHSN